MMNKEFYELQKTENLWGLFVLLKKLLNIINLCRFPLVMIGGLSTLYFVVQALEITRTINKQFK